MNKIPKPALAMALHELAPNCAWRVEGEDGNDPANIVWLEEGTAQPESDALLAKLAELTTQYFWDILRRDRDELLAKTDWWVVGDRTATAEQLAYRQALRDLPANTTDPSNPVWPTKP